MLPCCEPFLNESIPFLAMGTSPKNPVGAVVALHADVGIQKKHRPANVLEIALDAFFGRTVGEQEIPVVKMYFDGMRVVRRSSCQELERLVGVALTGFSPR